MIIVLKLLGLLITALGAVLLSNPGPWISKMIGFWEKDNRLYIAGGIRIALGILFLVGAFECRWKMVMIAVGLLVLVTGILVFVLGLDKGRAMLQWVSGRPEKMQKVLAGCVIAFGVLIVLAV